MSIELRQKLESRLASLREFLATPAHAQYVDAQRRDLSAVETRILQDDIVSVENLFELLDLRGQRKVFSSNVTLFEDQAATLEDRIRELREAEESAAKQQPDSHEEIPIQNE